MPSLGSFWKSFTGQAGDEAAAAGTAKANASLGQFYGVARDDMTGGRDAAFNMLAPWEQGGQAANKLYLDAIGANGPEAQQAYYAQFQNDPGFAAEQQAGINALDRSATARGGLYSGAQMKALHNFGLQSQRGAFQNRLGHLQGAGGQGFQAAGLKAGISSDTGNRLGELAYGHGQQQASNYLNEAAFKAKNANTFAQNYINLIGTAAKGAAAFSDARLKRDIGRIGTLPSGLPVYSFRYLWSDELQVGVMAQEARQMFPEAVLERDGFLMVDYSRIG